MILKKSKTPKEPETVIAKDGTAIELSNQCFYVDSNSIINRENFRFNNLHDAVMSSTHGTKENPMIIYIEPGVYQLRGTEEESGLIIKNDYVSLIGLTKNAADLILADNRGLHIGCTKNPATIKISGTGFHAENLTFGNFCNCNLTYLPDSSKNQKKRSNTITQAYCIDAFHPDKNLDRFSFDNVHFISMLDTIALGSVKRVFYNNCCIQGTDDFIGGSTISVFNSCTIHCFSQKPIYHSGDYGMAFFNCTWDLDFEDPADLMLTKQPSNLYLINCDFKDKHQMVRSISWCQYPQNGLKSSYHNIKKDGRPYVIQPEINGQALNEEQLLSMNSFTLLKGLDDWNPESIDIPKNHMDTAPIHISLTGMEDMIADETSITLKADIFPISADRQITWTSDSPLVTLKKDEKNLLKNTVTVSATNDTDCVEEASIRVTASNGIFNECTIRILPSYLPAPELKNSPTMIIHKGTAALDYKLRTVQYEDQSVITWYYLNNNTKGTILGESAVSRLQIPHRQYTLTYGDVGKYIIAAIEPKHSRSKAGEMIQITSPRRISLEDVSGAGIEKYNFHTDFRTFPSAWNTSAINGGWVIDSYKPLDQKKYRPNFSPNPWTYQRGINGTRNVDGFMTTGYGARLLYRVSLNVLKLMSRNISLDTVLTLKLNTEKNDGQGFNGTDGQYFEVYIKYNAETLTGYGLRIERTTMYSTGVCFTLYKYEEGKGKPLGMGMYSTAFKSACTIRLYTKDNTLHANVTTSARQSKRQVKAGLPEEVKLSATIEENHFYGIGLQHTGTISEGGRLQLTGLDVKYKR